VSTYNHLTASEVKAFATAIFSKVKDQLSLYASKTYLASAIKDHDCASTAHADIRRSITTANTDISRNTTKIATMQADLTSNYAQKNMLITITSGKSDKTYAEISAHYIAHGSFSFVVDATDAVGVPYNGRGCYLGTDSSKGNYATMMGDRVQAGKIDIACLQIYEDGTVSVKDDAGWFDLTQIAQNMTNISANKSAIASLNSSLTNYWSKIYPVGSVYISLNSTSPATLFGGTWEQITDRFLFATNHDPGATGGSDKHTLTIAELPSHNHEHIYGVDRSQELYFEDTSGGSQNAHVGNNTTNPSSAYRTTAFTGWTGGNQSFSTMPPYTNVYMWRRTA